MPQLIEPMNIGRCALKHRVVMAPMTRLRADDDQVPRDLVLLYYSQRASVPGTLLIPEATFIAPKSRGRDENAPGIFTSQQVEEWKRITDEVHAKGSLHIHVAVACRPCRSPACT